MILDKEGNEHIDIYSSKLIHLISSMYELLVHLYLLKKQFFSPYASTCCYETKLYLCICSLNHHISYLHFDLANSQ